MDWATGIAIAAALLAATTAAGVVWQRRTGRVHGASGAAGDILAPLGLDAAALGERATLVQFTSEHCAQCPGVARRLQALAAETDGVRHVEIDLTRRADLADRFRVLQTPTTLVLDGRGDLAGRIGGVPRIDELRARIEGLRNPHVAH